MSERLHNSEIAAPPVEWRHFRYWGLLVVLILALAVLAAVYNQDAPPLAADVDVTIGVSASY